jgi:hypothetical protein
MHEYYFFAKREIILGAAIEHRLMFQ